VSLNKSAINKLDNCIKLALAKIFNVKDGNIDAVREYCDLPHIGEKRHINFINNMLDYKFGASFLPSDLILP